LWSITGPAHQELEVGALGFAVFFFYKEFLFVAIIGSSIGRCREKVMTSFRRFSQIWLLTRARDGQNFNHPSISKPNIIFL
jgi:hypothetical protein